MGSTRTFWTLLVIVTSCSSPEKATTSAAGSGGNRAAAHDDVDGGKDPTAVSTGGSSGAGGSFGGQQSSGGITLNPSAECNHEACQPLPMEETGLLSSCCLADGKCGWSMKLRVPFLDHLFGLCEAFEQPGTPTTDCNDVVVYFSQAAQELSRFKGCCRPDGHCGAVIHDTSGCVAHEDIDGTTATCTP